jgi:hypothetical protein
MLRWPNCDDPRAKLLVNEPLWSRCGTDAGPPAIMLDDGEIERRVRLDPAHGRDEYVRCA